MNFFTKALYFSAIFVISVFIGTVLYGQNENQTIKKVGNFGVVHKIAETKREKSKLSPGQQERKETLERMDKLGILYRTKAVIDKDPKMLIPPEHLASLAGREYVIAETPPEIEFAIIQVEPMFRGRGYDDPGHGLWCNWSQAALDARTGKFYSSIGDHTTYGGNMYIVEYDPAVQRVRCLPNEVNAGFGRTMDMFHEGKIHGWLDFYQSKDLDSPHLWFSTFWGNYPKDEDYKTGGYDGAHIGSMDVMTGEIVDYGNIVYPMPVLYHRVDTKRGLWYGTNYRGEFFAWDINKQKIKWAGLPPKDISWWARAIVIDEKTGMVYSSSDTTRDSERDASMNHIVKYDPYTNYFYKLNCHTPANTSTSAKGAFKQFNPGDYTPMRAQTRDRRPDGLFYGVTLGGQLFSFDPDEEVIEDKGFCFPSDQVYTGSMERSPGGRYLYYFPSAHGLSHLIGTPMVQFDTQTGTIKVLAFLFHYYLDKYGYTPSGTYSIKLDEKGERLFILWNGDFDEHKDGLSEMVFGQCSVMLVTIPASERLE